MNVCARVHVYVHACACVCVWCPLESQVVCFRSICHPFSEILLYAFSQIKHTHDYNGGSTCIQKVVPLLFLFRTQGKGLWTLCSKVRVLTCEYSLQSLLLSHFSDFKADPHFPQTSALRPSLETSVSAYTFDPFWGLIASRASYQSGCQWRLCTAHQEEVGSGTGTENECGCQFLFCLPNSESNEQFSHLFTQETSTLYYTKSEPQFLITHKKCYFSCHITLMCSL